MTSGGFKLVILPATKTGMSRAELHHHLETVHGPLCLAHPDTSGHFRSYVHHYVEEGPPLLAGRDAVTMIGFDSLADMTASKASKGYRQHIGPDEDNFRDETQSTAYAASPHIMKDGPRAAPLKMLTFRRFAGENAVGSEFGDWTDRLADAFGKGTSSILSLTINRLEPLGGAPNHDVLEEVAISDKAAGWEIGAQLNRIAHGLFAPSAASLLTRPRVFV
jgi:EthD domain